MKLIPLTQGQFAQVDDADYDWLSQWKWCASWMKTSHGFYAIRQHVLPDGRMKSFLMHRMILGLHHGDGIQVDHINHDTLDNQRHNLRACTATENRRNSRPHRDNRSGIKGVSWDVRMGAWRARIKVSDKQTLLGYFDNPVIAGLAYQNAARNYFKEFAFKGEVS